MKNKELNERYGVPELSKRIGLSIPWIRKAIADRAIPFYKIGSRVIFNDEDIEEWFKSHLVKPIDD